jgi:hypothetical protein
MAMTDPSHLPLVYPINGRRKQSYRHRCYGYRPRIQLCGRHQGGNEMVIKNGGRSIVQVTQSAYDALSPPDASTLYAIVG